MKSNLSHFLLAISAFIFFNCNKSKPVVNTADYASYLVQTEDKSLAACNTEIAFWQNRLANAPTDDISLNKIASLYSSRFKITGKVEDLYTADSLYNIILDNNPISRVGLYQALAVNCITKHEFREGKKYIQKAIEIGDSKASSYFMLIDLNLELGDYDGARSTLRKIQNKNAFAYLIRLAKLKDHEGDLNGAILLMEKALDRIKENKSLFTWTKSNLADMYGHAGRVKEAYQSYLDVLKQQPDYDYALKGIAWIAFSNDHNPVEAKKIIQSIINKKSTPDLHLLLAQIASFEKNEFEKTKELTLFASEASKPKYLGMYNKYLCTLEAEDFSNPGKAIEIAELEIKNRPTPQSFDLLAWSQFQAGKKEKALAVAVDRLENKTVEPEALYHLGMMYASVDQKKSKAYLKEALKSSFELGPIVTEKIEAALN